MSNTIGRYRWVICALLFFATVINYLDRQVLSLLKPLLEDEFGWTNSQYANIASAFQIAYAVSMLFAGRIIDKLGTKKGYALAIVIWSLGAAIHGFALPIGDSLSSMLRWLSLDIVPISILGFMFSRTILGLGESGNFPAAIKATSEYFPPHERSLATGIFNSGANVGAILAPITVPWIAYYWGWERVFFIVGIIGLLWLIFWWVYYDSPEKQQRLSENEFKYINEKNGAIITINNVTTKNSFSSLFVNRYVWVFAFGKFMTDGVWWFFLFWLPAYLKDTYGMTGTSTMIPLAVLYSMTMIGSIGGGYFPTYYINKGYSPSNARMKAMFLIAIIPLIVLLTQPFGSISFWIPILLIGVGASAHQAWSANLYTTVSDYFPKYSIASVVGIGGIAGGIGGVIVTKVGGSLFDYYKELGNIETGYNIMFAFCATAYLFAWCVMKLILRTHRD